MIKGASLAYRLRGFSVLSAIAGFLWILTSITYFSIPLIYGILIFAVGIMAGAASGYYSEQRELKIIKNEGEKRLTIGNTLLILCCLVVIFALLWVFTPQINLYTAQTKAITAALFVLSAPFFPTFIETKIYVIKKWQSINHSEILSDSGFFTGRIYASPPQA